MKKVLLALSCASLLFASNYDDGLESYKNKSLKKLMTYFYKVQTMAIRNLLIIYLLCTIMGMELKKI